MTSRYFVGVCFASLAVLLCGSVAGGQTTFLVSTAGDNGHDGLTWATAKRDVQAGLDAASAGDRVWVAAGRYVGLITLKDGVALYGGFAGTEDPATFALSDRAITANATILDGNQLGSVVTSPPGATPATRIDGFTITGGRGTLVGGRTWGGGVYCDGSSPSVAHNRVVDNSAGYGAGIFASMSSARIVDNAVVRNQHRSGGGFAYSEGGGVYCGSGCSVLISRCLISGNHAGTFGGGILCAAGSAPAVADCLILGNRSDLGGGGGLFAFEESAAVVCGTLIMSNKPLGVVSGSSDVVIRNSVLRTHDGMQAWGDDFMIAFCNVEGGWDNTGCIDADPLFVRSPSPGPNGLWGDADDDYGDLRLMPGSPCIDAGSNGAVPADTLDLDGDGDTTEPTPFDFAGLPRFFDDPATPDTGAGSPPIVDIGPYEYPGFAPVAGDLDQDGDVDADDMKRFTLCMTGPNSLPLPSCLIASLDTNSDVDLADFAAFQRALTATP